VTGPAQAGKTAVAVGLAGELARDLSHHVLLVDLDVRHPAVAAMIQVEPELDLADVLEGRTEAADAVIYSEGDNLSALLLRGDPATGATRISPESVAGEAARRVLGDVFAAFDYAVIDAGSTEKSAVPRVLAALGTGALLVLPAGVSRERARSVKAAVTSAGGHVLGAVIVGAGS
jgi:Mrp family chromosome partitioning ATPase